MVSVVQFRRTVADSILSYSIHAYPKEGILLLRGKASKDEVLITDVLIPPLATHGRGFSGFSSFMLPMDLSVIGISHSHPSGALRPSIHDLNHFYGKIMVIAAYPYESYNNIGVFNSHGDKLPHEVLPDSQDPQTEETNGW
ncbi:MAG: Mov34/MPN/PAD-1 family protein [Candidatus Bathyarchaeia archaeon]|jgi:proteasome lid subunit RPN8/RPN11